MRNTKVWKPGSVLLIAGLLTLVFFAACASGPSGPGWEPAPNLSARAITGTINDIDGGNPRFNVVAAGVTSAGFRPGDTVKLEVGTFDNDVQIYSSVSAIPQGSAGVVFNDQNEVRFAINGGNFAQTYGVELNAYARITLVR